MSKKKELNNIPSELNNPEQISSSEKTPPIDSNNTPMQKDNSIQETELKDTPSENSIIESKENSSAFKWTFRYMGGMNQVTLETSEELDHLRELDPKIWAVLSCPSEGLEFDAETLHLIDEDKDGYIRTAEILQAVDWMKERIVDLSAIVQRSPQIPLRFFRQDTEAGMRLLEIAAAVLENTGKADQQLIGMEDIEGAVAIVNNLLYNGDGVLPPHPDLTEQERNLITLILSVEGGKKEASGELGFNVESLVEFSEAVKAELSWRQSMADTPKPLGENTAEAWQLLQKIQEKIEDYFLRVHLASFAPNAVNKLNADEIINSVYEGTTLDKNVLSELPLSHIAADTPLKINQSLNPIWRQDIITFSNMVKPLISKEDILTEEDWNIIKSAFKPYGEMLQQRPNVVTSAEIPSENPLNVLDGLSDDYLKKVTKSSVFLGLLTQLERDSSNSEKTKDIVDLKRTVLYFAHLHHLLLNFVSFYDFYSQRCSAIFQSGTLFIDGRSCRLCLPVDDIEKHSSMASLSQLCLLYCVCSRRIASEKKIETKNIVAAMTAGTDGFLRVGRNGVYVDNEGEDWDAALVKIVRNPISIKQALWAPYIRMSQTVGDHIAKLAGGQQKALEEKTIKKVTETMTPGPKANVPFDIGKSVGLFAAVGIALGALGTAIGSIFSMLMALHWWQIPLLFLVMFCVISGPAVFMAWLKLRKRNLGPLLEASGWAVNGQLPINLTLGHTLTSEAKLPNNTIHNHLDQILQLNFKTKFSVITIIVLIISLIFTIKYFDLAGHIMHYAKIAVTPERPIDPADLKIPGITTPMPVVPSTVPPSKTPQTTTTPVTPAAAPAPASPNMKKTATTMEPARNTQKQQEKKEPADAPCPDPQNNSDTGTKK